MAPLPEGKGEQRMTLIYDGVFKTRTGMHGERIIQIPATAAMHYKRYHDEKTGEIKLVPVEG
jgi:hypothetical protein